MNRKIIAAAIGFVVAVAIGSHFYVEWQMAKFDASLPTPPTEEQLGADETGGGHWHGDEWHADDAHENDTGETELIPSVDWQPSTGRPHEAVKPEGLDALDADDPVAKAWAKLDYIADNPFAWGGNADSRTPGLIAQLTPPPVSFGDYEGGPDDNSEELIVLLEELARLRDPRSIEVFVAYDCESPLGGAFFTETLLALGPPVVPHLIPYLDEALEAKTEENPIVLRGLLSSLHTLTEIGHRRWADLDGVTEHIILPRLEQMLAEGFLSPGGERNVQWAIAALKR